MFKTHRPLALILLLAFVSIGLFAETPSAPLPSGIRNGVLANGMRYFVQKNVAIKNRVEMRLVVHAGSVQEKDSERGFAHMVEHLQFQGTEHFAPQAIVDFLEKAGMKFGPEVNAFTDFTSTQYYFDLPCDKPDLLATGYQVLEDWAHGPKIDEARLETEKKVIQEERRQSYEGLNGRITDFLVGVLFDKTAYGARQPIGDMGIVAAAAWRDIDAFARRWYTPANQALIVVGDIDPAIVEKDLLAKFTSPFGAGGQAIVDDPPIPAYAESRISRFSDKDLPFDLLNWATMTDMTAKGAQERRRFLLLDALASYIVNQRFGEMSRESDPKLQQASEQGGQQGRASYYRAYTLIPMNGKLMAALSEATKELELIRQKGFTQSEFELAKKEMASRLDQAYGAREAIQNANRASDLAQYFLIGQDVLSDDEDYAMSTALLNSFSLGDLNEYTAGYMANDNFRLSVLAMQNSASTIPGDSDLLKAIAEARRGDFVQKAEKIQAVLVPSPPAPGRIVSTARIPEIQALRYTLSNGTVVIAKRTELKKDEILISAWAPGGLSLVDDKDYTDALLATAIFENTGIGPLSMNQYADFMNGKQASIQLELGDTGASISGQCVPRDLDTLFQLAWQRLSGVHRDATMEKNMLDKIKESVANSQKLPATLYRDEINRIAMGGHARSKPLTSERISAVDVENTLKIYNRFFGGTAGFTFVIIGDYDEGQLKKCMESWLATLPAAKPTKVKDLGIRPLAGPTSSIVKAGKDQKAEVILQATKARSYATQDSLIADVLQNILDIRLRDILRNEKGGTYGASVSVSVQKQPWNNASWSVYFTCDLARQKEMIDATLKTVDALRTGGFSDDSLAKAKEILVQSVESGAQENSYWVSNIMASIRLGENPADISKLKTKYEAIDRKAVQGFAKDVLQVGTTLQVILNPEK